MGMFADALGKPVTTKRSLLLQLAMQIMALSLQDEEPQDENMPMNEPESRVVARVQPSP